jgi:hypothetical protein
MHDGAEEMSAATHAMHRDPTSRRFIRRGLERPDSPRERFYGREAQSRNGSGPRGALPTTTSERSHQWLPGASPPSPTQGPFVRIVLAAKIALAAPLARAPTRDDDVSGHVLTRQTAWHSCPELLLFPLSEHRRRRSSWHL